MLSLLLVCAPQAEQLDLLKIEALQKPITLERKNMMITPLLKEICAKAGVTLIITKEMSDLKATVFVRNMPIANLLNGLASALGGELRFADNRLVFRSGKHYFNYISYLQSEAHLLATKAEDRLEALAKLTNQPFGSHDIPPKGIVAKDETPAQWAARKIVQPAYYALGVWWRVGHRVIGVSGLAAAGFDRFRIDEYIPWSSRPERPPRVFIDANSSSIAGTQILVAYYRWTGELKLASTLGPSPEQDPILEDCYPYARPPKALAETPFAKDLAAWETPFKEIGADLQKRELNESEPLPDEGYWGAHISLAERLQDFHKRTGVPVIADSFRVPAKNAKALEDGRIEDYLKELRDTEKCFLRFENDTLLIRHPAYWKLRTSEPPEATILRAEEVARTRGLNLVDFCDIARANHENLIASVGRWNGVMRAGLLWAHSWERFLTETRVLLRFDWEPLRKAYPALAALSCFTREQQARIINGEVYGIHVAPNVNLEEAALWGPILDAELLGRIGNRFLLPAQHTYPPPFPYMPGGRALTEEEGRRHLEWTRDQWFAPIFWIRHQEGGVTMLFGRPPGEAVVYRFRVPPR